MKTLALLWIGWCFVHSLLITGRFKDWVRKRGGLLLGSYRILYVVLSFITLIPVLWYQHTLPQARLFSGSGPWLILQIILLFYALIMFYGGMKVYDIDHFLGLSQWRSYRRGQPANSLPFTVKGILCYVRHPWYSGGLTLLWSLGPLTDVNLLARIILSLYLVIGTILEEKKLGRELGEPYRSYCQQVPMLVPWRGRVKVQQQRRSEKQKAP